MVMSERLRRLKSKKDSIILSDGEPFEVPGLNFPQLADFAEFAEKKDKQGALNYLLFVAFRNNIKTKEKDSIEGMTDNEIMSFVSGDDAINGEDAAKIIRKIQELSNLLDDETKKKLISVEENLIKENN